MNIEKLKIVRQAVVEEKELIFDYSSFFSDGDDVFMRYNSCSTTACVAGMTVFLFARESRSFAAEEAQGVLELTDKEADFLFLRYCKQANKSDALKRIDHLLSGRSVTLYNWTRESHRGH